MQPREYGPVTADNTSYGSYIDSRASRWLVARVIYRRATTDMSDAPDRRVKSSDFGSVRDR